MSAYAARKSNVDEALFSANKNRKAVNNDIAIVTNDELRQLRGQTEKGATREAGILSNSELDRIKRSTKIETKEDKLQTKKIMGEQREQQLADARARKARMIALDKQRAKKLPPGQFEAEKKTTDMGLLSKAKQQQDEEHDDVKHMNQMMLYSKVVTIRDKQLAENKRLEENWLHEQKRLDLMMEIERLKDLKAAEEKAQIRADAQRRGARVIVDQIQEREKGRIRERELLEKEQQQIVRQIEAMKEADMKLADEKKYRNQQMVSEVEFANTAALSQKAQRAQRERDEDNKIIRYNAEKDAKLEIRLAEERRIKEEKEQEVARLRELQEKAADRQAEIDALRAKRAFEERERAARAKEIADHEKKLRTAEELEVARKKQFLEREIMMAEQAKAERDAFLRVIEKQKTSEEHDRRVEEDKHRALRGHADTIRNQINANSEIKKQQRLDFLEEGRMVRQRLEDERLKVEGIKQDKLGQLDNLGIESKYKAELARKKIV